MSPDYANLPFQVDWDHFVVVPFTASGKRWERGDHFDWKRRSIPWNIVAQKHARGELTQRPPEEGAIKTTVGDGLDELTVDELHVIVNTINAKVKLHTKTAKEYGIKKCKSSTILEKQRGHIRRWRNSPWADMELR